MDDDFEDFPEEERPYWIPIGPWRAWLEIQLDTWLQGSPGASRESFAENLGVTPRALYRWLTPGASEYVRIDLVESALWLFDRLILEDVLDVQPCKNEKLSQSIKRRNAERIYKKGGADEQ